MNTPNNYSAQERAMVISGFKKHITMSAQTVLKTLHGNFQPGSLSIAIREPADPQMMRHRMEIRFYPSLRECEQSGHEILRILYDCGWISDEIYREIERENDETLRWFFDGVAIQRNFHLLEMAGVDTTTLPELVSYNLLAHKINTKMRENIKHFAKERMSVEHLIDLIEHTKRCSKDDGREWYQLKLSHAREALKADTAACLEKLCAKCREDIEDIVMNDFLPNIIAALDRAEAQ